MESAYTEALDDREYKENLLNNLLKNPEGNRRILSIQSHVVHGYVGNKCCVFPLQVCLHFLSFLNSFRN